MADGSSLQGSLDIEHDKINALKSEVFEEQSKFEALKVELFVEEDRVEEMITNIKQQKAVFEEESSRHNATKR